MRSLRTHRRMLARRRFTGAAPGWGHAVPLLGTEAALGMRPDQSRRAATVIAASGVEAGFRPGEKPARRVGAPRCAPSIFPPNSAPRGPGLAIAAKLRPRRRTRPAYIDARRAAVGGNERAVDLTQSEVLVTMHRLLPSALLPTSSPVRPRCCEPADEYLAEAGVGAQPRRIFLALTGPGGATRSINQRPSRGCRSASRLTAALCWCSYGRPVEPLSPAPN